LKIKLIYIYLIFIVLLSCKKYEDGPLVSFRSKQARIVGRWELDKVIVNGVEKRDDLFFFRMDISDGGEVVLYGKGGIIKGVWQFDNNKESIKFKFETDNSWTKETILRLKEKELWLMSREIDNITGEVIKVEKHFK